MRPRLKNSPERRRPSPTRRSRNNHSNGNHGEENGGDGPTPICRCRVLYLGSAVPHVTKDGLQGIQEPLKELYPEEGALGAKGIDSWLSVWSNGFLLENVDENRKRVTRFFPIESLHYCAAVRYVLVPGSNGEMGVGSSSRVQQRFLPLDSPFARNPNVNHPPLFAAILRRTTGIKVLECHVFICKRETAANALVRCAFHAYADSTYAKHLESGHQSIYGTISNGNNNGNGAMLSSPNGNGNMEYQQSVIEVSEDSINSIEKVEEWKVLANGSSPSSAGLKRMNGGTPSPRVNGTNGGGSPDEISVVMNGDDNHKVWAAAAAAGKAPPSESSPTNHAAEGLYDYGGSTLRSFRSSASGLSHRNRPRQMMMPASPPPPPIPEELQKEEKKDKKKQQQQRRSKSRDVPDMILKTNGEVVPRGASSVIGSRKQSVNSLAMYPPPPPRHMNGHGPMMMVPPPPPPPNMKKAGTFSARGKQQRGMPPPFMLYGPPPPQHLMPPPGHPIYGMMPGPPRGTMEEPIYMPHNARPISPIASYQPGHFPHEAYYNQQQYATIDKSSKFKKNKKNKEKNSNNGGSKHQSSDSNADDSEFGAAGIYKKGHINERAFSYSIRNEHRSRSFGSLANMENGNGHMNGEGAAAMQMMADMDLAGEEQLERREVPPGLYYGGMMPSHHPMHHPMQHQHMYGPPPYPHHPMMLMQEPMMMQHHHHQNGGMVGGGGGGRKKR